MSIEKSILIDIKSVTNRKAYKGTHFDEGLFLSHLFMLLDTLCTLDMNYPEKMYNLRVKSY